MVKCPFCGKGINSLETKGSAWYKFSIKSLSGSDITSYDLIDNDPSGEEDYLCPECYETIACSENGARAFLMHGELININEPRGE